MKMRNFKHFILIVIALGFVEQLTYSQSIVSPRPGHVFDTGSKYVDLDPARWLATDGVDTTNVDSINAALNGADLSISTFAAQFFAERKMAQFIPDIRARYLAANNFSGDGFDYLGALYHLGVPDIRLLVTNFVDSVYAAFIRVNRDAALLREEGRYSVFRAVLCIDALCDMGDYSRFNTFIEFYDAFNAGGGSTLYKFIGKLNQNVDNIIYKRMLKYGLVEGLKLYVDRPETFPVLLSIALSDSSEMRRGDAEAVLLDKYHDRREVFDLVVRRLYNEDGKSGEYGQGAAMGDLDSFNYPEVLIVLKDAVQNATFADPEDRQMAQDSYDYYEPPRPNNTVAITILIDSLSSLVSQITKLNWLGLSTYSTQLQGYLTSAKSRLQVQDSSGCAQYVKQFQNAVNAEYKDTLNQTTNFVTVEGWKFLYYNAQYILDRLPLPSTSGLQVKLINSSGVNLTTGTLQYYESSWKDATNNGDGTFTVSTTKPTISLRMTYEHGTQQKNNVTVGSTPVIFQTVNAQVKLQSSQGNPMDTGTVQYYAGAWRTFGTTINGTASKELLANNYSFRMTYAYGSNDKQQDLNSNSTVVFQTVNAAVQLKNSQGSFIDQGTVQYYSGAWRTFGTTTSGVATKELLPNNYSFRMTYAYGSNDKQQDIGASPAVIFQTVNASVQLKNSAGDLMPAPLGDQGTVQYYSGAWRAFGTTTSGVATKELLPSNYSFRMSYAYASKDKQQDLNTNPTVVFQTVNTIVQLKNSQGNPIDQGTVQYYSGAWRSFGTTSSGTASKELLPNSYQFRMTHEYVSNDKTQDVGVNNTVAFSTVLATVRVKNLLDNPVNGATVTYYSGAWRSIGTTPVNGEVSKELLPANLQFRAKLGSPQQDKTQNISTNPVVDIQLNINQ